MTHQQPIEGRQVRITGGFWQRRQQLNAERTIYAVKKRFEDTGRFDAYAGYWREGMPNRPHLFLTGDVEKWIEAVAYLRMAGQCTDLEPLCDELIARIEANQFPDGYYNMFVGQMEPTRRWTNRDWHELFAVGHLIEAAVAYYRATGKDRLLRCAARAADHVGTVFVKERSAAFTTPGHEEIELALVKLYRCTGERRYLELSRFFIDERGRHPEELGENDAERRQDYLPVREQRTAAGHAVRAMYLYSGMADLAREYGDESLLQACRALFDSVGRRMYLTGRLGSTRDCEGFTTDYDLPNLTAYTETCAAIGLMLFSRRMQLIDPDARYADTVERVLYNGFLSSTSLEGDRFFYENPLEIDPRLTSGIYRSAHYPIRQRVGVFSVSCCPPNIARTVASIGDWLYSLDGDTLFVHQYMTSEITQDEDGRRLRASLTTDYPAGGHIRLHAEGVKNTAVRIPAWCGRWTAAVSGHAAAYTLRKGYAFFDCTEGDIELDFDMTPYAVEASPHVREDAGRVAVMRGPVVYCLEGTDNGADLRDLHIDLNAPITAEACDAYGMPVLHAAGWRRDADSFGDALYRRVGAPRVPQPLRFIPYYAFANRGETEMVVWILP